MNQISSSSNIIYRFKKRWIPPGSLRERYWIEFVQLYRLFLRDGLGGILRFLINWINNGRPIAPAWWYSSKNEITIRQEWLDNLYRSKTDRDHCGVVVIYAGVPFSETQPLRSVWMTSVFIQMGYRVLFVYWRWRPAECYPQVITQPALFQLPMDIFWMHAQFVLREEGLSAKKKLLMIDFPHPSLFKIVNMANGHGWVTVMTQKDDWDAFHEVGQASWYDPDFELYLLENSDVLVGTAPALVDKMKKQVGREVNLVPNAYQPESLKLEQPAKVLKRGEVTLGYFGHLTQAWFDWELVKWLGERHEEWEIYLIGSGGEIEGLPGNVHLLGRKAHEELAGYAKNWDVALIPFKEGELSRGVDPLKVYEYLAMGLPVVVSGMPQLAVIPGVRVVNGREAYEREIELAVRDGIEKERVAAYLAEQTWEKRVEKILELTEKWLESMTVL